MSNWRRPLEHAQQIIAVRAKHGILLPDAFQFRYAQVALGAGLTETAIGSPKEYLVAAGREGEFYREALVVCPRNNLAIARMWPNGSSNGDSGPNRRNAPEINRQLVQETHH